MHMKKTVMYVLAAVLCLMFTGAFALENTVLDHSGEYFAMDLEAVNGTLYMLAEKDGAYYIAAWQEGDARPVLSRTPVNYALSMYLADAQPVDDGSRIVTMLFTDGSRLMSLDPVLGVVFSIDFGGGQLSYTDVAAVQDARSLYFDDMGYTRSLLSAACSGDSLYWLTAQWDENGVRHTSVDVISLTTGEVKQLDARHAEDIAVMPDGRLVLLIGDPDAYMPSLAVYDPASGTLAPKGDLWSPGVSRICFDPAHNAVLYMEGNRVMGVRNFMETLQYGYVPVEGVAMTVADGCAVVSGGGVTVIRQLQPNYQPAYELTVLGGASANPEAVAQYGCDHPDTAVYWYDNYGDTGYADHSYEAMTALVKEDQMDAGIVTLGVSGFGQMMASGECEDLSAYPELAAAVDRMYPPFRNAVMADGKLYGVPLAAVSWGWGYDPSTLAAIGLEEDDLPTNLIDLCAFITEWNNGLMDRYPDVALFAYVDDTRAFVLGEMISRYAAWCEATYGMLTFDTPEFRALLSAARNMSCDRIDARASDGVFTRCLLFNDMPGVGYFGWTSAAREGYAAYLPMAVAPGLAPVELVSLDVAFIPAGIDDAEAAVEMISFLLEEADPGVKATLFANVTEPVAYADYDEVVAAAGAQLDWLHMARDEATGDERAQYDVLIAEQEAYMRDVMPGLQWLVSADDLEFYRQRVAPHMYVMRRNCVSDWTSGSYEVCYDLLQRFAYGALTEDQLIAELQWLK